MSTGRACQERERVIARLPGDDQVWSLAPC